MLIKNVTAQTSKTGKGYWTVEDSQGNRFSIWDGEVAQIALGNIGKESNPLVETKGRYKNIVGFNNVALLPKVNSYKRDAGESRLIIRQTALKAAVEYQIGVMKAFENGPLPTEQDIIKSMEHFAAAIMEETPTFKAPQSQPLNTAPHANGAEIPVESIPF